jgi:spore coat polysaccharide biosynthesis protein SpsF
MGSTRLPGKVLIDLAGKPMLAQQIRRLREMKTADDLMVATTTHATDDPIVALARYLDVPCYRGPEDDVLARYVQAARAAAADVVVRVTADCPLIDPHEADRVVQALEGADYGADYAVNTRYPRGLDTEALYIDVLCRVDRLAHSAIAREHVTWLIHRERPELFLQHCVADGDNNADLRWTVDTPQDLAMVRRLYDDLDLGRAIRPYREVLAYVRAHPEISALNTAVTQKDDA